MNTTKLEKICPSSYTSKVILSALDYILMPNRCPTCGKKSMMANKRKLLRGNYNPVRRYKKSPNLQWAMVGGARLRICTSCIKTLTK